MLSTSPILFVTVVINACPHNQLDQCECIAFVHRSTSSRPLQCTVHEWVGRARPNSVATSHFFTSRQLSPGEQVHCTVLVQCGSAVVGYASSGVVVSSNSCFVLVLPKPEQTFTTSHLSHVTQQVLPWLTCHTSVTTNHVSHNKCYYKSHVINDRPLTRSMYSSPPTSFTIQLQIVNSFRSLLNLSDN